MDYISSEINFETKMRIDQKCRNQKCIFAKLQKPILKFELIPTRFRVSFVQLFEVGLFEKAEFLKYA